MTADWDVILEHILREGNSCADLLANVGAKEDDDLKIWRHPPSEMASLLAVDAMEIAFMRN